MYCDRCGTRLLSRARDAAEPDGTTAVTWSFMCPSGCLQVIEHPDGSVQRLEHPA